MFFRKCKIREEEKKRSGVRDGGGIKSELPLF
jgi:hypothetical protein